MLPFTLWILKQYIDYEVKALTVNIDCIVFSSIVEGHLKIYQYTAPTFQVARSMWKDKYYFTQSNHIMWPKIILKDF